MQLWRPNPSYLFLGQDHSALSPMPPPKGAWDTIDLGLRAMLRRSPVVLCQLGEPQHRRLDSIIFQKALNLVNQLPPETSVQEVEPLHLSYYVKNS